MTKLLFDTGHMGPDPKPIKKKNTGKTPTNSDGLVIQPGTQKVGARDKNTPLSCPSWVATLGM